MGRSFEYVILVSKYNRETVWTRYTSLSTPHRMVKKVSVWTKRINCTVIDIIAIMGWVNASINSQKGTGTSRRLNTRCPYKDTWNPRRAAVWSREEGEDIRGVASPSPRPSSLPPSPLPLPGASSPTSPARGCSLHGASYLPNPTRSCSFAGAFLPSLPDAGLLRVRAVRLIYPSTQDKPVVGWKTAAGEGIEGLNSSRRPDQF